VTRDSEHEHREQERAGSEQRERHRRAEAVLLGPNDAVDQHREAGRRQHGTGRVKPRRRVAAGFGHVAQHQGSHDEADRHIDQEDGLPPDGVRERPADQQPKHHATSRDGSPHRQGTVARCPLLEVREQDRKRRGREQRGAEALHRACADQESPGGRDAGRQRAEREQAETR
jgi:hypothetical protein